MAKILSFDTLGKEDKEKQERIARNQRHLENLASGEVNIEQAFQISRECISSDKLFKNIDPHTISYEDVIAIIKDDSKKIGSIADFLKKVSDAKAALVPFDWSYRIKAFDHSIIPFEHPVVKLSSDINTAFAGPIGILSDSKIPTEPVSCLYYRKNYLFTTLWDFCLFMAGTPKYKHFYTLLLSLKDSDNKCSYINKVLAAVRNDETFSISAIPRTIFEADVLTKSSKLEDYIGFSSLMQYAVEKALNEKFSIL